MKNTPYILLFFVLFSFATLGQNNTYSPYSRYGFGELNTTTFAHNMGMGGAYIAMKPDSTMPIFINAGNPAAYALIKLTSLEVGGKFSYSKFSGNNTSLRKWGTNFSYGALGFPIRRNGGACFGILPYTSVGYDTQNISDVAGIGSVTYQYSGTGGLNKAFLGYGIMPFSKRLTTFRRRNVYVQDSTHRLSQAKYKTGEFFSELLSDFSIGANANYIFGNMENTTDVEYPDASLYNNTYLDHAINVHDFTANFGVQTAATIDSVIDPNGRREKIERAFEYIKTLNIALSSQQLKQIHDSLNRYTPLRRRALKEKVKFTFGYFMALNNSLKANYSYLAYNYIMGETTPLDTVLFIDGAEGKVKLPLEQGFGVGFKKGERINMVADFAITSWKKFQYPNFGNDFKNSYRIALGGNFVPDKYASGSNAFIKRINYRAGISYQSGYITIGNSTISTYAASLGVGIPVGIGRASSMVNISAQYGQTGGALLKENFWRINFGFTFSDRWFQKFRYD